MTLPGPPTIERNTHAALPDRVLIEHNPYKKAFITYRYYDERRLRDDQIQIDAVALGAVNGVVILHKEYDPDQLWIPCVQAVLAKPPPTQDEREREAWDRHREERLFHWNGNESDSRARDLSERPIYVRDEWKVMYPSEERNLGQYLLPFSEPEYREFDARGFRYFEHIWDKYGEPPPPWPDHLDDEDEVSEEEWDRHEDKREPLTVAYRGVTTQNILREWLFENISGRFHFREREGDVALERYADWLHVRLRWSVEDKE